MTVYAPQFADPAPAVNLRIPAGRAIRDVPNARHVNRTFFPSQYFQNVDQNGDIFHIVVTRITYDLRRTWGDAYLAYACVQTPLARADVWDGEINNSSPLWESDYAPYKPRCDILVANAVTRPVASQPGKPLQSATRWACGIALDWQDPQGKSEHWHKTLTVTGPRQFDVIGQSEPRAAQAVPIHWQLAYGGQIKNPPQDVLDAHGKVKRAAGSQRWQFDARNPIGCGLLRSTGAPSPQLELTKKPFHGQKDYPPVSLCAVGRAWQPRHKLAGTYDKNWSEHQWPLPPHDFNYAYWNCAPEDQQTDYLPPGTHIRLGKLFPPDVTQEWPEIFEARLPLHKLCVSASFERHPGHAVVHPCDLDTLVFDMASMQAYATYRMVLHAPDLQATDPEINPLDWSLFLQTYLAPNMQRLKEKITESELQSLGANAAPRA